MKEFEDYPKYKEAWIRAFQRMCDKRKSDGKVVKDEWSDGQKIFDWWIEKYRNTTKGQLSFDENGEIKED